ncbi:unnamed protein product [Arctogadus glacialis]
MVSSGDAVHQVERSCSGEPAQAHGLVKVASLDPHCPLIILVPSSFLSLFAHHPHSSGTSSLHFFQHNFSDNWLFVTREKRVLKTEGTPVMKPLSEEAARDKWRMSLPPCLIEADHLADAGRMGLGFTS